MIVNESETRIISNMGWIDHGNLWVCDTESNNYHAIHITDSSYLTIARGTDDLFSVVHNDNSNEFRITARTFSAPEKVRSQAVFSEGKSHFEGDIDVWKHLPKVHSAYYTPIGEFCLFLINADSLEVQLQQPKWYDGSTYDKTYQPITMVTEVPDSNLALVSLQRCSEIMIHDCSSDKLVGKVKLASGFGNAEALFRRNAAEVWVADYDTIVCIDTKEWKVMKRIRLECADPVTRGLRYVGSLAFDSDERFCAVARPFSGNIMAIDTSTITITHGAFPGGRPHDVALLSDGRVYARDGHAGSLLKSHLISRGDN